jgi:hypothetical protein
LFVKIIFMVEQLPLYLSLMTKTHVKNFVLYRGIYKDSLWWSWGLEAALKSSPNIAGFGRATRRKQEFCTSEGYLAKAKASVLRITFCLLQMRYKLELHVQEDYYLWYCSCTNVCKQTWSETWYSYFGKSNLLSLSCRPSNNEIMNVSQATRTLVETQLQRQWLLQH